MIKVLYFARLAEELGCRNEEIQADNINQVSDLMALLQQRGEPFSSALANSSVLVSINQEMAKAEDAVSDGDEVAFFPPVTGG